MKAFSTTVSFLQPIPAHDLTIFLFDTFLCNLCRELLRGALFAAQRSGFDFPRGPGGYAPRFCCGLLDFSV